MHLASFLVFGFLFNSNEYPPLLSPSFRLAALYGCDFCLHCRVTVHDVQTLIDFEVWYTVKAVFLVRGEAAIPPLFCSGL